MSIISWINVNIFHLIKWNKFKLMLQKWSELFCDNFITSGSWYANNWVLITRTGVSNTAAEQELFETLATSWTFWKVYFFEDDVSTYMREVPSWACLIASIHQSYLRRIITETYVLYVSVVSYGDELINDL